MLLIILLVLFVLAMALWCAINAKAIVGNPMWFAFLAVLILGIVVFLVGAGVNIRHSDAW